MKRRIYLVLLPLLIGVALIFTWKYKIYPFRENPYLSLPVQFTSSNLPYTEIEIEGIKCLAEIDMGSATECSLDSDLLKKVSKQFYQTSKWIDLKGNSYESKEYILPLIKIKTAEIRKLKAKEADQKFENEGSHLWGDPATSNRADQLPINGRLGWILLQSLHPFFDFKNSVFFFTRGCKSLPYLKKEGYAIEKLKCSPFEITHFGCILNIETEYGVKRFLIDTGASVTLIKPSKFQSLDESKITIISPEKKTINFSKFLIGDQDYKDIKAYCFEFTDKFENIDGILGMSFFEEYIVFLDFDQQKAWIGPSESISKN